MKDLLKRIFWDKKDSKETNELSGDFLAQMSEYNPLVSQYVSEMKQNVDWLVLANDTNN